MADVDMPDATREGDGNIIILQLESPPSLSFHDMRLADLIRFQIKPVNGIPLNQQAPGVYLHPTEADTILTVSAEPPESLLTAPDSSPYLDALAAEEAAIDAEMARYDDRTRKALDDACRWHTWDLFIGDAFPTPDQKTRSVIVILRETFELSLRDADEDQEPPDAHVQLVQRRGVLNLEICKNEVRPLVLDRYHLSSQAEQTAQSAVVTALLQDSTFLHQDGEAYRAPILKDAFSIIRERLWSSSKFVDDPPPQAIGFSATALECCLDEWKSGRRVDLAFKADSYERRYREHLEAIRHLASMADWHF
ncbi:hypothetical protein C8J56DRAFT_913796 [Mycena floridula]|nr:hypothetical protein C8J56DRAFT_913796 [Mycena floridula]